MQLRKEAGIGRGWLLLRIYLKRMNEQQIGRLLSLHGHGNLYNNSDTNDLERWEKEDSLPGKNWFL